MRGNTLAIAVNLYDIGAIGNPSLLADIAVRHRVIVPVLVHQYMVVLLYLCLGVVFYREGSR